MSGQLWWAVLCPFGTKKLTLKNFSDYIDAEYKFFNSPKLNQQVFNYIKKNLKKLSEGKLNEGKRRQLEIPVMDKIKTDKILKSMRMKYGKHYDIGVGKRNSFILDVDVKYLDKLLSLLMKYRVRVR